jgi:hypothetical protein
MGFIFRTIFWLTLAVVVLPPKARIGGHDTADFRDMDLELELHNATYAAWSMATGAVNACDTNPQLCSATADLWHTTWKTVATMAVSAEKLNASDANEDPQASQSDADQLSE